MQVTSEKKLTLSELTQGLDVSIRGDRACVITGVSPIQNAQAGHITFLTNSLYKKYLTSTQASAVILSEKEAVECPVTAIITANPYYTYAKIAGFFSSVSRPAAGIHPSVVSGEQNDIHPSAYIAANCVIGNRVTIGANAFIGPGCVIGDDVCIGEDVTLEARVTIYHACQLGQRVRLAAGVVIGSDGFGYANHRGTWHTVPQLGRVILHDDVEVGANTTIDRGAIEDTVIEEGVKLDNLIQVGHNVRIGAHTVVAGCVGIAGSATIGKHCMIGGATCIAGHISICDQVMVTGMSGVTKSITEPGVYSSGIQGIVTNHEFRKNNARFHRLDSLIQRVKSLELELKRIQEREPS